MPIMTPSTPYHISASPPPKCIHGTAAQPVAPQAAWSPGWHSLSKRLVVIIPLHLQATGAFVRGTTSILRVRLPLFVQVQPCLPTSSSLGRGAVEEATVHPHIPSILIAPLAFFLIQPIHTSPFPLPWASFSPASPTPLPDLPHKGPRFATTLQTALPSSLLSRPSGLHIRRLGVPAERLCKCPTAKLAFLEPNGCMQWGSITSGKFLDG